MKVKSDSIFWFLSLLFLFPCSGEEVYGNGRRILHQPLFPLTTLPAPPPLPPPPLPASDSTDQDQPFFHELPTQPVVAQPPPAPGVASTAVAVPVSPRPPSPAKKVAVVVAFSVLTAAMVIALAFYLSKMRANSQEESRKLVGGNSIAINAESRLPPPPPPSSFLYIGTVEPSASGSLTDEIRGSPYRKLNSGKAFERYRPSPELQPLPPLPKKPPPPRFNSPPTMSSSDDDTNFYTPQGSSLSNGSPVSRRAPQSKRTSPKSRLSLSSPDTKPVIIPSIKQSLPPSPPAAAASTPSLGPPLPSKRLPYTPKTMGPKFPPPPPPPDITRLRSITSDDHDEHISSKDIPIPPPPPLPVPEDGGSSEAQTLASFPKAVTRRSTSPTASNEVTENSSKSSQVQNMEDTDGLKPKLKPLHWDKVRATSERATIWDQFKSSSFQLNEDAMESLFGCNSSTSGHKDVGRKPAVPIPVENRVLDPKKSQNIAILLRALNVTVEEVSEALLDGSPEGLGVELLETLVKMAPTKEEEIKLKGYNGEISKLGSAERFVKSILDVPFAFKRVEIMLYRANFENEIMYLANSFQTLEEASEELKNSRSFLKLLEAVLRTGNRMNDGTNRGDAKAFKLDTLLKLVDIKGTDGKTTLLHFVVQEIIRSQGFESNAAVDEDEFKRQGLTLVSGLSKELGNVKKAACMDSDVLSSYVNKLEMGLEKVKSVMIQQRVCLGKFFDTMNEFVKEAGEEMSRIKAAERKALSMVKEVTEYFHGDGAKEEAHPFRIFMIVRDFLLILDNVCKDVGKLQDRGVTIGAGRSFRMAPTTALPLLHRYNIYHNGTFSTETH